MKSTREPTDKKHRRLVSYKISTDNRGPKVRFITFPVTRNGSRFTIKALPFRDGLNIYARRKENRARFAEYVFLARLPYTGAHDAFDDIYKIAKEWVCLNF